MILGVGAGTFAVLFAAAISVVIAAVGSYLIPRASMFMLMAVFVLPLIVYGCILTAPRQSDVSNATVVASAYREQQLPSTTDIVDTFLPVRLTIFLLVCSGTLGGVAYSILSVVKGPSYEVPRVKCLRQQLEEAHPTWYR